MQLTATISRPHIRFAPTHADVLFIALLAFGFLAGENGMTRLLMDGDTGVHIRIGDWVREHGAVPRIDLFGFSKPHGEWFAYEWLSGIVMSIANSVAGLKGVTLLFAVLLTCVPVLIALHGAWRGAAGIVLLPMILLGTSALNIQFLARPHVFTLVLLAIAMWIIERDRCEPSQRIWLVVPLMALWSNMHGGFFIMLCLRCLLCWSLARYLKANAEPPSDTRCFLAPAQRQHLRTHTAGSCTRTSSSICAWIGFSKTYSSSSLRSFGPRR